MSSRQLEIDPKQEVEAHEAEQKWVDLKPENWSEIPFIEHENIGWRPAQMPAKLSINIEKVNRFHTLLQIDRPIELRRLDQEPTHDASISGVNKNGEAVARQALVKAKSSSKHEVTEDSLVIKIDFDMLLSQAVADAGKDDEKKYALFAYLVEHAFQTELFKVALKDLTKEFYRDGLFFTAAFINFLFFFLLWANQIQAW